MIRTARAGVALPLALAGGGRCRSGLGALGARWRPGPSLLEQATPIPIALLWREQKVSYGSVRLRAGAAHGAPSRSRAYLKVYTLSTHYGLGAPYGGFNLYAARV